MRLCVVFLRKDPMTMKVKVLNSETHNLSTTDYPHIYGQFPSFVAFLKWHLTRVDRQDLSPVQIKNLDKLPIYSFPAYVTTKDAKSSRIDATKWPNLTFGGKPAHCILIMTSDLEFLAKDETQEQGQKQEKVKK